MKSNAKVNRMKKAAKNSSLDAKSMDQDRRNEGDEAANAKINGEKTLAQNPVSNIKFSKNETGSVEIEGRNDLWMLKYDINEKGVGKILLPPSLSTLLQSDRVSISPSAGGLFIRSI
jgi:hypothetical protein